MTTKYAKIAETTHTAAGEVVAVCEASSRQQAMRKLRVGEEYRNAHLYEVTAVSRLAENIHDPRGLIR